VQDTRRLEAVEAKDVSAERNHGPTRQQKHHAATAGEELKQIQGEQNEHVFVHQGNRTRLVAPNTAGGVSKDEATHGREDESHRGQHGPDEKAEALLRRHSLSRHRTDRTRHNVRLEARLGGRLESDQ
jgi:hypothetical protein